WIQTAKLEFTEDRPVTVAPQQHASYHEFLGRTRLMRSHPSTRGGAQRTGPHSPWPMLGMVMACHTVAIAEEPAAKTYSNAVVAKAEKILQDVGLKRSGRSLVALEGTDAARALGNLNRTRRDLRQKQKDVAAAEASLASIQEQIRQLKARDVELNLQLARVAGTDVSANNRIVALINAGRTASNQAETNRKTAHANALSVRSVMIQAEAEYAEEVFGLRKEIDTLRDTISQSLDDEQVTIALRVLNANFDVPSDLTADDILRPLSTRLSKVESEVFRESIGLEIRDNGSLFVTVSINNKPLRMVVDSGATMMTLPAKAANDLGVEIPPSAPRLRLVLANGQEIGARAVNLGSVRVGQFEATGVRAAILDAAATDAEPLLGMSYLGRFKFEIDAGAATLSLLRVAED
ncbi:MAG: TIGR02281 family clan AA aspartic protease, partial [Planctomycetota bacterium]